jgi:hypothetical protein
MQIQPQRKIEVANELTQDELDKVSAGKFNGFSNFGVSKAKAPTKITGTGYSSATTNRNHCSARQIVGSLTP